MKRVLALVTFFFLSLILIAPSFAGKPENIGTILSPKLVPTVIGDDLRFTVGDLDYDVLTTSFYRDGLFIPIVALTTTLETVKTDENYKYSYNFSQTFGIETTAGLLINITIPEIAVIQNNKIITTTVTYDFNDAVLSGWTVTITKNNNNFGVLFTKVFPSGFNLIEIDPTVIVNTGTNVFGQVIAPFGWQIFREDGQVWIFYGDRTNADKNFTNSSDFTTFADPQNLMPTVANNIGGTWFVSDRTFLTTGSVGTAPSDVITFTNVTLNADVGFTKFVAGRRGDLGAIPMFLTSEFLFASTNTITFNSKPSLVVLNDSGTFTIFENNSFPDNTLPSLVQLNETSIFFTYPAFMFTEVNPTEPYFGLVYTEGDNVGVSELIDGSIRESIRPIAQLNGTIHLLYQRGEDGFLVHRIRSGENLYTDEEIVFNFDISPKAVLEPSTKNVSVSINPITNRLYAFLINQSGIFANNWTQETQWNGVYQVSSSTGNFNGLTTTYNTTNNGTHVFVDSAYIDGTNLVYETLILEAINIAPTIDNVTENPTSPQTQVDDITPISVNFSATITDDIALDTVIFNVDLLNITVTSGTDVFSTIQSLTCGSHDFFWFANDTAGNINTSSVQTFTLTCTESESVQAQTTIASVAVIAFIVFISLMIVAPLLKGMDLEGIGKIMLMIFIVILLLTILVFL